jgi:hypothetical protein
MRTKLVALLALFVAFSAASFAQTVSHDVTVDLTENRTLTINGFPPTLDVQRGAVAVTDTSTELEIFHDLGINQKVTVQAAISEGDWADRFLRVTATNAGPTFSGAITLSPQVTLISDGILAGVQNLATAIDNSMAAGDYVILEYEAEAGTDAVAGTHKATVTYTMLDN